MTGGWKLPDKFNSRSHKDLFNADGTHEGRAVGEVGMTVIKAAKSITTAASTGRKKKNLCTRDCGPFCPPGVKGVFLWVSLCVWLASGGLVAQYVKTFCQNPGEHFFLLYMIRVKGFRWFAGAGAKGFSA